MLKPFSFQNFRNELRVPCILALLSKVVLNLSEVQLTDIGKRLAYRFVVQVVRVPDHALIARILNAVLFFLLVLTRTFWPGAEYLEEVLSRVLVGFFGVACVEHYRHLGQVF